MEAPNSIQKLAKTYVWWKKPQQALDDQNHFLCQIMRWASWDDAMTVLTFYGNEAFMKALQESPPGIFDERSWNFWHCWFGLKTPEMPLRKIG